MSRRRRIEKREINPDPKYKDLDLGKFINLVMVQGKKGIAERIVYNALDRIQKEEGQEPLKVFHEALSNVKPVIEVRSRRVGGATYQVPVEVRAQRGSALAFRWIINSSRKRSEATMITRLSAELIDAAAKRGASFKKRQDVHKMAESNRAFSHYRW